MPAPRTRRHVRIAIADPITPTDDLDLTERRFPPSLAGWREAANACDSYNRSPRVSDNYHAWPVLVVPAEDDRAIKSLRRLLEAVIRYRADPTETAGVELDAEAAKAAVLMPVFGFL